MGKKTITQRTFARGVIRPEFLERNDLDARNQSLQAGENVIVLISGAVTARYGTDYLKTVNQATKLDYIEPADGLIYAVVIGTTYLTLLDVDTAAVVYNNTSAPWASTEVPWVAKFGAKTYFGTESGIWFLDYNDGSWLFNTFSFSQGPTLSLAELSQPYWVFDPADTTTIQPSARTGVITVTTSAPFFTAAYVGLRIRYLQREMAIMGYIDTTHIACQVVSELPPTYDVSLDNVTGARLGDAVLGQDTGFTGIISAITGTTLTIATMDFFDGPDVGEIINWSSGGGTVASKVEVSPAATDIWDEPLMSSVRGWPRSGTAASGRLVLTDMPQVPNAVALSSVRDATDFYVGQEDDDAIVRTFGDNQPRFRHVVNAGDLLLFSDKGTYYVPLRDNGVLTPTSIQVAKIDGRGCNDVVPVVVGDAVAFVSVEGASILLAALDGNIYLKWSVRSLTATTDAVKTVRSLAGPIYDSGTGLNLFMAVNTDGTAAVLTWDESLGGAAIGFIGWKTQGTIRAASAIGPHEGWMIVDRIIDGTGIRCLEGLNSAALLDCQVPASTPSLYGGQSVHVYGGGYYIGEKTVSGGRVPGIEAMPAETFIGFNFESSVQVWPAEIIDAPKAGMIWPRIVQGSVTVQGTGVFQVVANGTTKTFGGYAAGDDLSAPPPDRTMTKKFIVKGKRDFPEIIVKKPYPANWTVLAVTQEVHF